MSEAKFTPGPWQAEQDDVPYDGGFETWCVNADGAGICMMDCPKDDMEANARLISAAPDLLEAAEEIVKRHVSSSHNAIHPSGRFCDVCGLNSDQNVHTPRCPILAVEKAVAKAKGESQ